MYKGKRILAVIPARAGSKGLPGKNTKELCGKPLIAWSIEAGLKSELVDEVIVSTDGNKIADVAKKYGARVPFMRPDELASDTAGTMDVLIHAIDFLKEEEGKSFDILILLEPTSPLREMSDIDACLKQLIDHEEAVSIAGICEVESAHPDFLVTLNNGMMRSKSDFVIKRRQELDTFFFFEGTIYASTISALRERRNFYHGDCLGYVVPKWKSFEIDDLTDFVVAEAIMNARTNGTLT